MKKFLMSNVFPVLICIFITLATWTPSLAMPPLDISTAPAAPDYELPNGWLAKPTIPSAPVDVFFVYPTVLFNDTNWIMDTNSPDMRAAAKTSLDTQAIVFKGQANIYVPMYRQMNLAGLGLGAQKQHLCKELYTAISGAL